MRWALPALALAGCASVPPCGEASEPTIGAGEGTGGNVLLVILDDVGVEQLAPFGIGNQVAPTPTLDCLCERSVRFDRAWATPVCSPSRAELLTGRSARRYGIGGIVHKDMELPASEVTLAEVLGEGGYRTGLFGKWHLGGFEASLGATGPNVQGFERFAGSIANLVESDDPAEIGRYFHWFEVVDGQGAWIDVYAPTRVVNRAIDFVRATPEPWFVVLSLHSAHVPTHAPPRSLLSRAVEEDAPEAALFRAMLEAGDAELGRFLRELDPAVLADTTVIVAGDNGTSGYAVPPPFDPERAKGALFELGVRVPLLISGPQVSRSGVSTALVHLLDVMPTVAAIAGIQPPAELDGVSLLPLLGDPASTVHDVVTTTHAPLEFQRFVADRAARDERYKLVRLHDGTESLYRLDDRFDDGSDVLAGSITPEEALARAALGLAIDAYDDRAGIIF